ncbi:MAG: hypothetical protein CMP11_07445 [Zetaproteobacteria bacterium]|nr:hypothetical protein [Pseudobdellovibrionaceae bacterium]
MIKLIFMLFFINLFFFVSCKKVATNNYEVELSEALDNFEEEKFDLAIEDFKDLLTRKPTDTLVTKYLSQSYILIIDISYTAVLESLAAFESDSSSSPDLKSTLDLLPDESTENTFNIVQALKYLEDSIQVTEDESKKQALYIDLLQYRLIYILYLMKTISGDFLEAKVTTDQSQKMQLYLKLLNSQTVTTIDQQYILLINSIQYLPTIVSSKVTPFLDSIKFSFGTSTYTMNNINESNSIKLFFVTIIEQEIENEFTKQISSLLAPTTVDTSKFISTSTEELSTKTQLTSEQLEKLNTVSQTSSTEEKIEAITSANPEITEEKATQLSELMSTISSIKSNSLDSSTLEVNE